MIKLNKKSAKVKYSDGEIKTVSLMESQNHRRMQKKRPEVRKGSTFEQSFDISHVG